MPFGAEVTENEVRFRLWAPKVGQVDLKIATEREPRRMRAEGGWHRLEVAAARPGALYQFVLPGGQAIPDPASRFQPQDVHGPSEVIDPAAYEWRDALWRGRPWHQTVLYELHIGAFTEGGTFGTAIDRLDALADLGITALEIMPVADFPGKRNWGYDGVSLFAPDSRYGRPEDMKAFIDGAHQRGLMVILDVVYNHFGPDGNYLPAFAPIFTDHHQTPWGNGINFDDEHSETVRSFIVSNARYWIEEYNLDGLRLDAVHMMKDDSERHILQEIADEVRASVPHREVHLIIEDDKNTVARLIRSKDGRPLHYTAQWNDDLHHAIHVIATGEDFAYYAKFARSTEKLARALAWGFSHPDGAQQRLQHNPCAGLPPTAFIAFLQNHDQIGNRAFGDRLIDIAPPAALRAGVAICMLSPQIPLLFMGEEWGTTRPFPFFCDFNTELSKAVRAGRRKDFGDFPAWQEPGTLELMPDPTAEQTFLSARLDWENADRGGHPAWRALYRDLLALRRKEIVPRLVGIGSGCGSYDVLGDGAVLVRWRLADRSELTLTANLSGTPLKNPPRQGGRRLWVEGFVDNAQIGPWTVVFSLRDADSNVR
jgi:maltooligosyltrehalose trehalohydrolase